MDPIPGASHLCPAFVNIWNIPLPLPNWHQILVSTVCKFCPYGRNPNLLKLKMWLKRIFTLNLFYGNLQLISIKWSSTMSMSTPGLGVNTKVHLSRNQIATIDEWIIQQILKEFCKGDGFIYLGREWPVLPVSFFSFIPAPRPFSVPDNPIYCDYGLAGLAFLITSWFA